MALVLFANTKGGSGKTTAALVLAGELVNHRAKVVLLEGDPNRPLMNWAHARSMPSLETSRSRVKSPAEACDLIEQSAVTDANGGRLAVVHDDDQEGHRVAPELQVAISLEQPIKVDSCVLQAMSPRADEED